MSYRIEEKIPVTKSDCDQLQALLFKKGMSPLYPARIIKSIYFDNTIGAAFSDSEEGVLPRKKIRIRDYPLSSNNEFLLETKISSVEGRYKMSNSLAKNEVERHLVEGIFDTQYGLILPSVGVEYQREYFVLDNIRITFDRNILYFSPDNYNHQYVECLNVIEIKAPSHVGHDFLTSLLPIPRRRFSKFANAYSTLRKFNHL